MRSKASASAESELVSAQQAAMSISRILVTLQPLVLSIVRATVFSPKLS